jgi:hypothetical protein
MTPIEAAHTCQQCGYAVNLLPVRTGRPETLWVVRRGDDWGAHTLPRGGKFNAAQLVAFTEALP